MIRWIKFVGWEFEISLVDWKFFLWAASLLKNWRRFHQKRCFQFEKDCSIIANSISLEHKIWEYRLPSDDDQMTHSILVHSLFESFKRSRIVTILTQSSRTWNFQLEVWQAYQTFSAHYVRSHKIRSSLMTLLCQTQVRARIWQDHSETSQT